MRVVAALLLGIVLGIMGTVAGARVAGGWYTYRTVPVDECRVMPPGGEVVPHQPNPCHFRYPRWP